MNSNDFIFTLKTTDDKSKIEIIKNIGIYELTDALLEAVLFSLYNLSKFSNQVIFIDNLYNNIIESKNNTQNVEKLIKHVIKIWPEIETNRKDKFYYFLEKFCSNLDISQILEMDCHYEIENFLLKRKETLNTKEIDEIVAHILIEKNLGFVAHCLELIVLHKENVSKNATKLIKLEAYKKEISDEKRRVFYNIYKKIKNEA
ncbi:hypothetical protein BDAP_001847 [Binucleata daphniae]